MSGKGKKFDAAEKHFLKKEEQYKKQLKGYAEQTVYVKKLENEIFTLRKELANKQLEVDKLLELQGMTKEEFQEKLATDKLLQQALSIFSSPGISKYLG